MAGKCACPHGCNAECDEQAKCPICWNGGDGCPLLFNLPVSKEWLARALAEAKDQERFRKQYLGNWPATRGELEFYLSERRPEIQRLYRDAAAFLTMETDSLEDDFQIAAEIDAVFGKYAKRSAEMKS